MNTIIIKGRLVRDPELKVVGSDLKLCNFSVAVDREHSKEKAVDYFDCVAFRQTAEFVTKYFFKGKEVLIRGRMQSRDWTDKEGKKRRSWELNVDDVFFCGSKSQQADPAEAPVAPPEIAPVPGGDPFATADGDLPF